MKKVLISFLCVSTMLSCKKGESVNAQSDVKYHEVNEEYYLIQDVDLLKQSDDEVSQNIKRILSGEIDETIISTGQKSYDIDNDKAIDIGFEILDLRDFNGDDFPSYFDHLAARVIHNKVEILDNSTYGYSDALQEGDLIDDNGHWSTRETSVLGTFAGAGRFNGRGERYLAFRFFDQLDYKYGWVKLECSTHNDTLRIISYAYNDNRGFMIRAGQTE